ncbi:MAG: hypothetical protein MHM6MM_009687 [Cercozoa sp. M6MM]
MFAFGGDPLIEQPPQNGRDTNEVDRSTPHKPSDDDFFDPNDEHRRRLKEIALLDEQVDRQIARLQAQKRELASEKSELLAILRGKGSSVESNNSAESAKSQQDTVQKYETRKFNWSARVEQAREAFGIPSWRPLQLAVVNCTLSGRDAFVQMPSGGGKSLCYQLPAVVDDGITVVLSPLLALIYDQVRHLQEKGVEAASLTSESTRKEQTAVRHEIKADRPRIKLVYVTPERVAKSKTLMSALEKCYANGNLKRFVIDEAHCCSQWGHDFRPDYAKLGILKRQFPDVPILALTATATKIVRDQVEKILEIEGCERFSASLNRPNLHYEVVRKQDKEADAVAQVIECIKTHHANHCGIVYVFSRKNAETLAEALSKASLTARAYHANLPVETRKRVQDAWQKGSVKIVVATIAFGLGVDKPNVRFVMHFTLSKSVSAYYQESGRAGRDGKPSRCVLFYHPRDVFRVGSLVHSSKGGLEKLSALVQYCHATDCRRTAIAANFDDESRFEDAKRQRGTPECCDLCCTPIETKECGGFARRAVDVLTRIIDKGIDKTAGRKRRRKKNSHPTLLALTETMRGIGPRKDAFQESVRENPFLEGAQPASDMSESEHLKRVTKEHRQFDAFEAATALAQLLCSRVLSIKCHHTSYSTIACVALGLVTRRRQLLKGQEVRIPLITSRCSDHVIGDGDRTGLSRKKKKETKVQAVATQSTQSRKGQATLDTFVAARRHSSNASELVDLTLDDGNHDTNSDGATAASAITPGRHMSVSRGSCDEPPRKKRRVALEFDALDYDFDSSDHDDHDEPARADFGSPGASSRSSALPALQPTVPAAQVNAEPVLVEDSLDLGITSLSDLDSDVDSSGVAPS